MKIKEGYDASTSDFFYDLFNGGYLNPLEICESEKDARRVINAMEVIKDFFNSCEEQIEGFIQ